MMDTVLNLGLNDEVVVGLAKKRGERFAYDCYRRLLDMFGDVVLSIDHEHFEHELASLKVRAWAGLLSRARVGAALPAGLACSCATIASPSKP